MPKATISAPDDGTAWHREQIAKAARCLFAADGTIEQALDSVLQAARHEFGCTVIITRPAVLHIDGYSYRWPDA
jgi:hypothetical protein